MLLSTELTQMVPEGRAQMFGFHSNGLFYRTLNSELSHSNKFSIQPLHPLRPADFSIKFPSFS